MLLIDGLKLKSVQTVVSMSLNGWIENPENLALYDMAGISFWIYF